MKRSLMLAGVLAILSAGTAARADDDDCYVPMSKWQPMEAVRSMAEAQGWKVRRIKIDDGCYEIKGYDASGREIEVKLDPATLAVVEMEYEDDDDDYKYRRNGAGMPPAAPANPPENGLFAPGAKPKVIIE